MPQGSTNSLVGDNMAQLLLPLDDLDVDNPEQKTLRTMESAELDAWFYAAMRPIRSVSLWVVKVDGHLVATGTEEEWPEMLQRFRDYVHGPDMERRSGGMG